MERLTVKAKTENLAQVLAFVDQFLESEGCPMKAQLQIDVAVEEIFVNIASYAYEEGIGETEILISTEQDPPAVAVEFRDRGMEFNPLEKPDPDTTLSAEERQIGGLGIYMVKKSMDEVIYWREDGQNILLIRKKL